MEPLVADSQAYSGRMIRDVPEISALDARSSIIRIPPELDVPLTPRMRRIVDSRAFRRLSGVSQLGFVRMVYPGATHTRFEHSLGVCRLALLVLKRLAYDERFSNLVRPEEAETFILASLLHDLGHFPFCHLLEDLKIPGLISHEEAAEDYLMGELAPIIKDDWNVDPQHVCDVLMKRSPRRQSNETDESYARRKKVFNLLSTFLSGPIDVDKMDYLMRDSHAAGVPYGKNYDLDRLVGSICLNESGNGVAITEKGKTAAELMVFARYVMFSEVYWHHAARSATIMFQRAISSLLTDPDGRFNASGLRSLTDAEMESRLLELCGLDRGASEPVSIARELLERLFGQERRLYKRLREFSSMESSELYARIAGRPWSAVCAVSDLMARKLGTSPSQLLIDAPPADKEVEFKIDVFYPRENEYRPLSKVSPVVRALAQEQFDDCVKRVRLFADPDVASGKYSKSDLDAMLKDSLDEYDAGTVSER